MHHSAKLTDGRTVDIALVESAIHEELAKVKPNVDAARCEAYEKASRLMRELIRAPKFVDFLTLPAYTQVLQEEGLGA